MLKKTSLSSGNKPLSKKALRKFNPSALAAKKEEKDLQREEDNRFYQEIWDERLHKDGLTGLWLGLEPLKSMFHHILPKHLFPEFMHCKWNILVTDPNLHNQIEINPELLPNGLYLKYLQILGQARDIAATKLFIA